MRNWWIRFGCFLTGYNYTIVANSSEVAAKAVKRYTAAMVIVCILWAFVGFAFTQRYLKGSLPGCIAGALIAVIIIVQIERQIILAIRPSAWLKIFRGSLAFLMALIGAAIIDQIILKQDIELEKIDYNNKKVNNILPSRTAELKGQIDALDTTISTKERERQKLIDDVNKRPLIANITTQATSVPVSVPYLDTVTKTVRVRTEMKQSTSVIKSNSINPNQQLIRPLDSLIGSLRAQKALKEAQKLNIRPALLKEINDKTGFLDELKIMYILISNSWIAFGFWLLWVLFLLFIEMLVLSSKIGDKENDYERTVLHQMALQMRKLDALAGTTNGKQLVKEL
jgi:hypothetical protein